MKSAKTPKVYLVKSPFMTMLQSLINDDQNKIFSATYHSCSTTHILLPEIIYSVFRARDLGYKQSKEKAGRFKPWVKIDFRRHLRIRHFQNEICYLTA